MSEGDARRRDAGQDNQHIDQLFLGRNTESALHYCDLIANALPGDAAA